jgi:hypothetical protein
MANLLNFYSLLLAFFSVCHRKAFANANQDKDIPLRSKEQMTAGAAYGDIHKPFFNDGNWKGEIMQVGSRFISLLYDSFLCLAGWDAYHIEHHGMPVRMFPTIILQ